MSVARGFEKEPTLASREELEERGLRAWAGLWLHRTPTQSPSQPSLACVVLLAPKDQAPPYLAVLLHQGPQVEHVRPAVPGHLQAGAGVVTHHHVQAV